MGGDIPFGHDGILGALQQDANALGAKTFVQRAVGLLWAREACEHPVKLLCRVTPQFDLADGKAGRFGIQQALYRGGRGAEAYVTGSVLLFALLGFAFLGAALLGRVALHVHSRLGLCHGASEGQHATEEAARKGWPRVVIGFFPRLHKKRRAVRTATGYEISRIAIVCNLCSSQ